MDFLADERLYADTEACLQYLRELSADASAAAPSLRLHLYWHGDFSRKAALAVKSALATQDLERVELWLWLDAKKGYRRHERNAFLRPLLPFLRVERFDADHEVEGTPLEGHSRMYRKLKPVQLSDLVRHVVLYKHGGFYADADTVFLRDLTLLLAAFPSEFCYRWSYGPPYANSAYLRLHQGSETGRVLLERCAEVGGVRPKEILRFDDGTETDLLVLPAPVFDPLWLHRDGHDRYADAPFDRFEDFFRRFDDDFRRTESIRSHRDFFSGAFAYHWHRNWDARECDDSYFGLLDAEFSAVLRERLGVA